MVKTRWLRGEIAQARALYQSNLESLQRPEHGLYYCWALNEVMVPMHCFLGELPAAREAALALGDAATRQVMQVRQHAASCASMAIDLIDGKGDLGAYLGAVDVLRHGHFASLLPWLDSVGAEQALRRGDPSLAIRLMDRAIHESERSGSRWWSPELRRIRGASLRAAGSDADQVRGAEDLLTACMLARQQRAAALELSAASELARGGGPMSADAARVPLREALARAPEVNPLVLAGRALLEASH